MKKGKPRFKKRPKKRKKSGSTMFPGKINLKDHPHPRTTERDQSAWSKGKS